MVVNEDIVIPSKTSQDKNTAHLDHRNERRSSSSFVCVERPRRNFRASDKKCFQLSFLFGFWSWITSSCSHRQTSRQKKAVKCMSNLEVSQQALHSKQYTVYSSQLKNGNNFIGEHVISHFLSWAFRSSFIHVLSVFLVVYGVLIVFFSALILLDGRLQPNCIGPKDILDDNQQGRMLFVDAFALSWTTFSTVGYGNIHPALNAKCGFIAFLCSAEAFFGVLYAGFSGAIIFAKVIRIQARAAVVFTDALCIHYEPNERNKGRYAYDLDESFCGNSLQTASKSWSPIKEDDEKSELNLTFNNDVTTKHEEENTPQIVSSSTRSICPCPVLEFRLINTRANGAGGEILNAHLSAVVSLKAENTPLLDDNNFAGIDNIRQLKYRYRFKTYEEGSLISLPKQTFRIIELETPDHPFFRRVWYGRHVLNEESPLLKPEVVRSLQDNDGIWPSELKNVSGIRSSLINFNDIIVSLSGTSNDSADDVYARKIYKYDDICIGWQFADVAYYDDFRQNIFVDLNLVNDIVEQHEGGGELLNIVVDETGNRVSLVEKHGQVEHCDENV